MISEVFENRVDKFAFNWGKDVKKCFHHTVEMANDAQFGISTYIKVTPAPGEIVSGGFRSLGSGGRWNEKFGDIVWRVTAKVTIENFQAGAARE